MFDFIKQSPITILIALATVAAFLVPSLAQSMELDTSRQLTTQVVQVFSCHLLHWSFDHLSWDLFMFVLVGVICERRSCWGYFAVLTASAVLIPVSVVQLAPTLSSYRGLSGIDTGIFAFAAILLIEEAFRDRNWSSVGIYGVLFVGLIGKTAFELMGGGTLLVESTNFSPVPIAHVVGGIVGVIVAVGQRIIPLSKLTIPT